MECKGISFEKQNTPSTPGEDHHCLSVPLWRMTNTGRSPTTRHRTTTSLAWETLTRFQPHILTPECSLDLPPWLRVFLKSWLQISCRPAWVTNFHSLSLPKPAPCAFCCLHGASVGWWHTCLPAQYLETSALTITYIKLFPEVIEKREGGGSWPIWRLNGKQNRGTKS